MKAGTDNRPAVGVAAVAVKNVKLISVHDFYRSDKGRSYVSIGMRADYRSGALREHRGEGRLEWTWMRPKDALRLKLFSPDRVLIKRFLSNDHSLIRAN